MSFSTPIFTTPSEIWAFAKAQNDVIVSKDADFRERSFVEGFPPKIVWLSLGNAGTLEIADRLLHDHAAITQFVADPVESLMIISSDGRTV